MPSLRTLATHVVIGGAAACLLVPVTGCEKGRQTLECSTRARAVDDEGSIAGHPGLDSNRELDDCLRDVANNRDCYAIRKDGRAKIRQVSSLFVCRNGRAELKPLSPTDLSYPVLPDFSRSMSDTTGDCSETVGEFSMEFTMAVSRVICDENGQPYDGS